MKAELHATLEQYCRAAGITMAWLVEDVIMDALRRHGIAVMSRDDALAAQTSKREAKQVDANTASGIFTF
jgi:hypothetical protein